MSEKRKHDVDPDAPPSDEEFAAAARLREALENPHGGEPGAELLRSLAAAHAPRSLDADEHHAILARAIAVAGAAGKQPLAKRRRGAVVTRLVFAVGTAVAIAAAMLLVIRRNDAARLSDSTPRGSGTESTLGAQLAVTRSTQPLFDAPFAAEGGETSRADRIAMARGADLRENRFARWGVR